MDNNLNPTEQTVPVTKEQTGLPVGWDAKVIGSFAFGLIFLFVGFYKLLAYTNSELGDPVNAYVEGDAYNYIINAGQATAYFVLTLTFVLLGCTFFIVNHLKEK